MKRLSCNFCRLPSVCAIAAIVIAGSLYSQTILAQSIGNFLPPVVTNNDPLHGRWPNITLGRPPQETGSTFGTWDIVTIRNATSLTIVYRINNGNSLKLAPNGSRSFETRQIPTIHFDGDLRQGLQWKHVKLPNTRYVFQQRGSLLDLHEEGIASASSSYSGPQKTGMVFEVSIVNRLSFPVVYRLKRSGADFQKFTLQPGTGMNHGTKSYPPEFLISFDYSYAAGMQQKTHTLLPGRHYAFQSAGDNQTLDLYEQ